MSYVQSNTVPSGVGVASLDVPFGADNAAGNCLVADIMWFVGPGGAATTAVTDSQGNTWTQVFSQQQGVSGQFAEIWVAQNCKAGANTVTATYVGGGGVYFHLTLAVHEYGNIAHTSAVDAHGFSGWTPANTATATLTTGHSNDLLHTFCCIAPNAFLGFPGAGWNIRENNSGSDAILTCDTQISTPAPSTQSATFIKNPSSVGFFVGLIALKQVGVPAPGTALLVVNEPTLGFTDRSSYLQIGSTRFTSTLRQRGTADISLLVQVGDSYTPTVGCQILLYDKNNAGSYLAWGGIIDSVDVTFLGDLGTRHIQITAVSFEKCFDTLLVPPQTFFYQTAESIFVQLLNSVANGVPVVAGTINAPFVINVLECNWSRLSEIFTQIATAATCIWGVDLATMTVYLKPVNATASPFTLTSEQVVYGQNKWSENQQDYRNRQIVRISEDAFAQSAELFAGNGSQTSFTLKRPAKTVTFAWTTKNAQNHAVGTFSGNPSNGDTVTIGYPQVGSIYNWAPNAPYNTGQVIVDPANHIQVCTVQGTSGGSQPAWNDSGGTTSDGPGSPNPSPYNGGVVWQDRGISGAGGIGASLYTFVDSLDNRVWGQVLIGSSAQATAQHLADAINSKQASAGQTYSWPTWENQLVNADEPNGALAVTVRNKNAGSGYLANLDAAGGAFSWSGSVTSGGSTVLGTVTLQIAAQGSSNTANLYYTPGSAVVTVPIAPPSGTSLQVQYTRAAGDCIVVEDTDQVNLRAVLENGTGRYQQIVDDSSNTSNTSGLQKALAALAAFSVTPISFAFKTFRPGLAPGQWLDINFSNTPVGVTTLIPANTHYVIQEISADLLPIYSPLDPTVANGGRYEYTVTVINVEQVSDYLEFWQGLGGGSGGGGSLTVSSPLAAATSGGTFTGLVYTLTAAADGSFTPDFSLGSAFRCVLTRDAVINAPINQPASVSVDWALELDQDSTGGHAAVLNPAYNCRYTLSSAQSPLSTRCVVTLTTDQTGLTYPNSAPSIDQPIP